MNRNILIIVIIVASLITVPSIYYFVYLPSLPKDVNFVFTVPLEHGYWEYAYAKDAGFYREEGLNVSIIIVRTPVEMVQSLLAGESEFCMSVGDPLVANIMGATNLKIVLATGRTSFALIARAGIDSFDDVKSIAIPGRGNAADILTREYLINQGLEPDVDVSLVNLNWPSLLPALLEGQVDATTLGTVTSVALQAGGKILWSYPEEFPDYLMLGIATTDELIAQRPEMVKAMVRAIYRSQIYLMTHKEEAIEYATDILGLEEDYATFVYEWGYEGIMIENMRLNPPSLPIEALNYTMRIHAEYLGEEEIPLDQWVDFTFLQQVEEELGTN